MVRAFEAHDLTAVIDIWLDANLQAHSFVSPRYWTDHVEMVKQALPQAEVYVHVDDATQQIDGFIGCVGDYIEGIFIRQDRQSHGIGTLLLNFAKARKLLLRLHVYQHNARALQFYLREGFMVLSERTDEATGQKEYEMGWKSGCQPL